MWEMIVGSKVSEDNRGPYGLMNLVAWGRGII